MDEIFQHPVNDGENLDVLCRLMISLTVKIVHFFRNKTNFLLPKQSQKSIFGIVLEGKTPSNSRIS